MTRPYSKILLAPSPPNPKHPPSNSSSYPARPFNPIQPETSFTHQLFTHSQSISHQQEEEISLSPFKRKRYSAALNLNPSPSEIQPKGSAALESNMTNSTDLDLIKNDDSQRADGDQSNESSIKEFDGEEEEKSVVLESKNAIRLATSHDYLEQEEEDGEEEGTTEIIYSLHIEVRLRSNSTILYHTVRNAISRYINDNFTTLQTQAPVPGWEDLKFLADQVYSVYCAECAHPSTLVPIRLANLHIHVYELPVEGEDRITMLCANPTDSSELGHDVQDNEEETTGDVAASKIQLPANRFEGVWESLIYENDLKTELLNYIYSSIIFAEQNVNPNLIAWHRLVLLHGPPGTGKTSLCKSLAQKVSIRLSGIYQKTELVEINSHSLFSKWFSESGKLVHSLFSKIEQIAEDSDVLVLVLIDEVESLAGCRSSGASGGEPSDALRAVNSLLTALDKLKRFKNVLVLTTSNLTGSIDEAFLDRADLKLFIPLPSSEAIYWILHTCLRELIHTKILTPRKFLDHKEALMARDQTADQNQDKILTSTTETNPNSHEEINYNDAASSFVPTKEGNIRNIRLGSETNSQRTLLSSLKLLEISEAATGMSGRALRRLPLLAHTRTPVTTKPTSDLLSSRRNKNQLNIDLYLTAMLQVAINLKSSSANLTKS